MRVDVYVDCPFSKASHKSDDLYLGDTLDIAPRLEGTGDIAGWPQNQGISVMILATLPPGKKLVLKYTD